MAIFHLKTMHTRRGGSCIQQCIKFVPYAFHQAAFDNLRILTEEPIISYLTNNISIYFIDEIPKIITIYCSINRYNFIWSLLKLTDLLPKQKGYQFTWDIVYIGTLASLAVVFIKVIVVITGRHHCSKHHYYGENIRNSDRNCKIKFWVPVHIGTTLLPIRTNNVVTQY